MSVPFHKFFQHQRLTICQIYSVQSVKINKWTGWCVERCRGTTKRMACAASNATRCGSESEALWKRPHNDASSGDKNASCFWHFPEPKTFEFIPWMGHHWTSTELPLNFHWTSTEHNKSITALVPSGRYFFSSGKTLRLLARAKRRAAVSMSPAVNGRHLRVGTVEWSHPQNGCCFKY